VRLNIVCFGIKNFDPDRTAELVADLQTEGLFAPSTTIINGRMAIRAAIVNHRTELRDIDALVYEITTRL